jgi:hypothetical protein
MTIKAANAAVASDRRTAETPSASGGLGMEQEYAGFAGLRNPHQPGFLVFPGD